MRKLFANDIIKRAKPVILPCPSIYFLINTDTIVYVGISNRPHSRIEEHKDKVFNLRHIVKCKSIEEAKALETHYITTLKPQYNKSENEDHIKQNTRGKKTQWPEIQRNRIFISKDEYVFAPEPKRLDIPDAQPEEIIKGIRLIEGGGTEYTKYTPIENTEYKNVKLFDNQYIKKKDGYIFRIKDAIGYIQGNALLFNNKTYLLTGAIGQIIT